MRLRKIYTLIGGKKIIMKFTIEELIEHSNKSVENSKNNLSKLSKDILSMDGMSGNKTRHLYNNLCSLNGANYLEVGTWKGSSFASALYDNNINAIAIDNWTEFNGPKSEFIENIKSLCPLNKYYFIEKDCFKVTQDDISEVFDNIDIYLYDGAHDYMSQRKAITHYYQFLSKYSIIIVDDFRSDTPAWANVKKGTYDGIEESGLTIHHKIEIITHQESSGRYEYWNGFGLFVCEKKL